MDWITYFEKDIFHLHLLRGEEPLCEFRLELFWTLFTKALVFFSILTLLSCICNSWFLHSFSSSWKLATFSASLFAARCIMLVWDHGSPLQPCKCPLCRRQITLLVPSEGSATQRNDPEVNRVLNSIRTYNRHFGGNSTGLNQVVLFFT